MIKYDSSISIKENAQKNNCSEASVRLFIKNFKISRRTDRKHNIIENCKNAIENNPQILDKNGIPKWNELQKITGHSLSTIRKYRNYILSNDIFVENIDKNVLKALGIPERYNLDCGDVPLFGTILIGRNGYEIHSVRDILSVLKKYGSEVSKNDKKSGAVYFGISEKFKGLVKIGSTNLKRINKREKELLTSFNGYYIDRYIKCENREKAYELEKFLHERFSEKRVDGEWFDISQEELTSIYDEYNAQIKRDSQ